MKTNIKPPIVNIRSKHRRKVLSISTILCFLWLVLLYNTSGILLAEDNPENVITIKNIDGLVQIKKGDDTNWEKASKGATLSTNHKIRTLLESRAELEYSDGTILTLRENSILDIKDISYDLKTGKHKKELKLNLGGMKYKVTPLREKGSEFKIHSSTAIVGVTGTEGIIATEGEGKPTTNTLVEGSTYNTDENGLGGRPLKEGNTWLIDEEAKTDKYMAREDEVSANEYTEKDPEITERFDKFVTLFNQKKAEGYIVDEDILEKLTHLMMARDYPGVKELLDEAEKSLADATKPTDTKAQKITEELTNTRKELEEKEAEGFDLKDIYLLLYQAEEAYKEKKYDACLDLIEQIKIGLLNLVKSGDDFPARLNQLMDEISEKAKMGFMVDECIELAKKSDIAYRNGAKADAEALLQKAKEMLFQAKRIIPKELLDGLAKLKEEILVQKTEGFDVLELEGLVGLVDSLLSDGKYIEAEQILRKIKEKLPLLTKTIPKELAYPLKTFEEKFAKKEAGGFDLTKLQNLMKSIYEAKESGDFEKLNTLLLEATALLKELELPEGLLNRLKEFKGKLQELKETNLSTTEIENLAAQIESALTKEDLIQVRRLLDKVDSLLLSLKDTEPPTLQVSDLAYTENSVLVSGVVKDNVKIDQVTVNGALASLDDAGAFNKELLLTSMLKEVIVSAKDIEGNVSPEIIMAIPEEKLAGLSPEESTSIPELNANDITLSYTEEGILVTGKTDPGAIVSAGALNVTADTAGEFSLSIDGSAELVESGLTLTSLGTNGNTSPEIKLGVEDKWLPELEVDNAQLYDNMPPSLTLEPLTYQNDLIGVKGTSIDTANITIQGRVLDIGLGVETVTINGGTASLETGGIFKHTVLLTNELKSVDIELLDKAGNKNTFSRPLDLFLYPALVTINGREINADEKGGFSADLPQTADLKEIAIQAKDKLGNETTPVKLMVADMIVPSISLGDIHYEIDSVKITGQTEPDSLLYDTTSILFQDKVSVDAAGLFTIELPRPQDNVTGKLVAQDASGNVSEEVEVTIAALKDEKPPKLTVANLIFTDDKVIVSGVVEDDTGIESVTVNNVKVELVDNSFYKELLLSADLVKIVVVATDLSGKTDTIEQVTRDDSPPTIYLEDLVYEKGYCIVKGVAKDNLGLKEVKVNDIPIYIDLPGGGNFEYTLTITAGLEKVVVSAIDLYGNYHETEPKEIVPPLDRVPPILTLNKIIYGSPKAIVSGTVSDNIGLKSVLINDKPIDFYEDGTFKVELDIEIGLPGATLNNAIYTEEFVLISGTVNLPTQEPSKIKAIAEDLAGNKSMEIQRDVKALDLGKFKVEVDDMPVDLKEGSFKKELIMEQGMGDVVVQVYDSLGNVSEKLKVPMETVPPILEINEEVYEEDRIVISGKASDEGSGLAEILINNASIDFNTDSTFLEVLPISESTITIVALDRVGNMTSSIPIEVSPPDTYPPIFVLGLNPIPATIGKDLTVTIDVLDSKTQQPEILEGVPLVNATLSNGEVKPVEMSGSGASFYGALSTTDLPTGLITLAVEGKDTSGNFGNVIDGLDSVLLNTTDTSAPSFSVSLSPSPPAIVGTEVTVNTVASETLKSLPKTMLALPDGTSFEFAIEGTLTGTSFTSTLSIPADTIPGTATIQLTDAVDLADNPQTSPTIFSFEIESERVKASLPLRIEFSEITNERIVVRGITSSQAIVHIELGEIKADIAADDNGSFDFIKAIFNEDIERMRKSGTSILLNCHATNYAGLISEKISLNIPLPSAVTASRGGKNFTIEVSPYPLEQGQTAQLNITSSKTLKEVPNVSIRLSNGRTELIDITGSGKKFQGVYRSTQATSIGQAIIQLKSRDLFESIPYTIVPSSETYAFMAGAGFFTIIANPDPLPIGKELDVSISTERPITEIPTLDIRLPNGKLDSIVLSGEGNKFNGKYLSPKDIHPGPAELIVNMGKRNESRRPFGIAPPYGIRFREGDIFTFSNPRPMATGSPVTVTVKSRNPLEEIPVAELRTSDGKLIPITLSGSIPGQVFTAAIDILKNVSFGPAVIIVKDKDGNILDEHPTEITPGFSAGNMEVEAFMAPSPAMPGQVVMINVNSTTEKLGFRPRGKLIFSDGLITPFNLEGPIPGTQFKTSVTIPLTAALGPVNIMIMDSSGAPIGGGQGYISRTQRGGGTGEIKISVMPPNPMPGNPLEISISSVDSLKSIKVVLDIPGKGPRDIRVDGPIPGNRFRALTSFPRDAQPRGSRIDVVFDRGAGEEIKSFFLEGRRDEEGHRPPELNPYPPMPGKPLVITLYAPSIIDFLPNVRVNYTNGNVPVNMNGPIPGDRFTGTLPNVAMPVTSIDVLGPGGELLVNLPIETIGGQDIPHIEIMPQPLMPGMPANLMVDFPRQVFSLPTASIKLTTGRMIPITLTGPIPGNMFRGMFSIPYDTPFGQANLEVYMANQLIPGGIIPVHIGGDTGHVTGDMLGLMVFPGGMGELNLDWNFLPRAEKHRIHYEAPGIPRKTIDIGRMNHYFLTNLEINADYKITVVAFDKDRREITRSEYYTKTTGRSYGGQGFPLYVHPAGPGNLQVNWDHQPGAIRYNLFYILGRNDPLTQTPQPVGNATSYFLSNLSPEMYQFQVEAILSTGETILSELRDEYVSSTVNYGRPPIELIPYPPIVGQPLDIDVMLPMVIPVLPSVKAQYLSQGEDAFTMSGSLPGANFHGFLTSVKDTITAINFYDPMTGELKHSEPIGGGTYYMPGDIPHDLYVRIMVEPEPTVGSDVNIKLDFNQEIDFQYLGLRLLVDFVGGRGIETPVSGTGPAMTYQAVLSASQHTETIETIGIEGPRGIVPEEYLNTQASGGIKAMLSIMPDPPMTGSYTQIKVNIVDASTYQPRSIDILPEIEVDFADGMMRILNVSGTLPGSEFYAEITAATFYSPLSLIDVLYNGIMIGTKTYDVSGPSGPGAPNFNPDPPMIGQPLHLVFDIPFEDPPASMLPKVRINYASGIVPANEEMEITGAIPGRHFEGFLAQIKGQVMTAEFIDPMSGATLYTHYFSQGIMPGGGIIETTPDPPYPNTTVNIRVITDAPQVGLPILKIFYSDNSMESTAPILTGELLGTFFSVDYYTSKSITKIEAWDAGQSHIIASRYFGAAGGGTTGMTICNPMPPIIGQPLYIEFNSDSMLYNYPVADIIRTNNTAASLELVNGALPGMFFSSTTPFTLLMSVERIEIWNYGHSAKLDELFIGGDAGEQTYGPMFTPNPPIVGQPLSLVLDIPTYEPAFFDYPIVRINYAAGIYPASENMQMSGMIPGWYLNGYLPEVKGPVETADFLNPSGGIEHTFYFSEGGMPALEDTNPLLSLNPDPPILGTSLQFSITTTMPVRKPIIEIVYEDGSLFEPSVSGEDPGMSFTASLSSVTKLIEKIHLISGINDPYPDETVLIKYISGGLTALRDASPVITITPYPPILNDYIQINISTTELVDLPLVEIWYTDGNAYELPLTGDDPGMSFNWSLNPLTKTIERVELYSGMDDPYPDELVETHYINLGTLPYPANVWLESGGLATEVFVNWDSVPEADGYFIYYSTSSPSFHSSNYVQIFEPNITREIVTGLSTGYTYYFTVSAYVDDGRESGYDTEKSWVVGSGGAGTGSLTLITPSPIGDSGMIDFGNVSPGTTSTSATITIQNTSTSSATIKKLDGFLTNVLNPSYYISSSNVNFTDGYSIPPSGSESQTISVSVPSGASTGEYLTISEDKLVLYDDINGNDILDSGESFVKIELQLTIGAAGLDAYEPGVMFEETPPGATTSSETIHVQNTAGSTLTNIQTEIAALHKDGDYSKTIPYSSIIFDLNSSVTGTLGVGETTSSTIYIVVPSDTTSGIYGGTMVIYNDTNYNYTRDNDEPFVAILIQLTVSSGSGSSTVDNLSAVNRGTGGTVDLTWTDSNSNTDHYHVYHSTTSGSHSWGSPQLPPVYDKAVQITGLTDGIMLYFVVRSADGLHDSCTEDTNTTEVSATPTTSSNVTPPTFSGITSAYANGISGQVVIESGSASDTNTPISYLIYSGTDIGSIFDVTPISISSPPYTMTGLTDGTLYYFAVRAKDYLNNEEKNTRIETAIPYASVNHITITSESSSSTVGSPVLVKLTAYSSTDDSTINTSFADSVKIQIAEAINYGQPRCIISLQDRVTDDVAEVAMASGEGYFTIDAVETTTVEISTIGITSNTKSIDFTGTAGSSISQFAIEGATSAKAGDGTDDGALIWISALDSSGKVITDYAETIYIDISETSTIPWKDGSALSGSPIYEVTYTIGENGEMKLYLKSALPDNDVIIDANDGLGHDSNELHINFYWVDKYLLESAGQYTISAETIGSRIKYTAYATTSSNTILNGYNGPANWIRISETTSNNSSMAIPSSISFVNGMAEFYVENSEYETVVFRIEDASNSTINSGNINAIFTSEDTAAPEIIRAEAETPFLIHLYFSEEIDSENAFITSNYTGVGTIDKICWYQDEVTIHLNTALPLGSAQSITIEGDDPNGIKDLENHYMGDQTENFTVPNVDYQGTNYGSSDWLEIQTSPSNVSYGSSQTIHVMVYHKNACGYMSGANAINRATDVSNVTVTYGGSYPAAVTTGPSSSSMSNGTCEFDITVNFPSQSQSFTITASCDEVTSGEATISSQ
ncbi:MAG: FecR domain-containing protein [Candidatus Omnitrophica bacterium]|nr:FecR domain-containing protein [Candidatus Omnitrophota bacterium]